MRSSVLLLIAAACATPRASQSPHTCPAPSPPPLDCWALPASTEALVESDLDGQWPGHIEHRAVVSTIRENSPGIRYCRQAALYNELPASYPITLRAWVRTDGIVEGVRVVNSHGSDALARCIARCAATWRFAAGADRARADITIQASSANGPRHPAECAISERVNGVTEQLSRCIASFPGSSALAMRIDTHGKIHPRANGDSQPDEAQVRCAATVLRTLELPNATGHDMFWSVRLKGF